MRLIFVAGDVGGARALAPVAHLATADHAVWVVENGAIVSDHAGQDVPWVWVAMDTPKALLAQLEPDMVVFASSMTDPVALDLALAAQDMGLPTAHILDNWSNYAARLVHVDGRRATPDMYAVMDDLAAQSAAAEGVENASLVVTGTPALAHVQAQMPNPKGGVIFASEPVSLDQGRDPTLPTFRGYTEDQVLALVLQNLQPWADQVQVQVFAHPRETPAGLADVLHHHAGAVAARVLAAHEKPAALAQARAVIGMSSILLYESWLAGLPVLSVQPNLALDHLRYLEGRPGLICVDQADGIGPGLKALLTAPPSHAQQAATERARHQGAAARVLTALADCLRAKAKDQAHPN